MQDAEKAGLTKTVFYDGGRVTEVRAHVDGIRLEVEGGETVHLTPARIERIVEMAGDWWGSHWQILYEKEMENDDGEEEVHHVPAD